MLQYKKNPGRQKTTVIEVDGKWYNAKYVGKGRFSRVYRVGDRVVYYTMGDCGKEVLAMFQYDRLMHLPEIIRHENITTVRGIWYVFSSPYYRNVRASDTSAYKLMMKIVKYIHLIGAYGYIRGIRGHDLMRYIVDDMKRAREFPHSIIKAMEEIVEVASNCGDKVGFDLHKNNFGVNEYGVLIFRDPIVVRI